MSEQLSLLLGTQRAEDPLDQTDHLDDIHAQLCIALDALDAAIDYLYQGNHPHDLAHTLHCGRQFIDETHSRIVSQLCDPQRRP